MSSGVGSVSGDATYQGVPAFHRQSREIGMYQVSGCLMVPSTTERVGRDRAFLMETDPLGIIGFVDYGATKKPSSRNSLECSLREALLEQMAWMIPGEELSQEGMGSWLTSVVERVQANCCLVALVWGNALCIVGRGDVGFLWEERGEVLSCWDAWEGEGSQMIWLEWPVDRVPRHLLFASRTFLTLQSSDQIACEIAALGRMQPHRQLGDIAHSLSSRVCPKGSRDNILTMVLENRFG